MLSPLMKVPFRLTLYSPPPSAVPKEKVPKLLMTVPLGGVAIVPSGEFAAKAGEDRRASAAAPARSNFFKRQSPRVARTGSGRPRPYCEGTSLAGEARLLQSSVNHAMSLPASVKL